MLLLNRCTTLAKAVDPGVVAVGVEASGHPKWSCVVQQGVLQHISLDVGDFVRDNEAGADDGTE
jgi:hypothetical protein